MDERKEITRMLESIGQSWNESGIATCQIHHDHDVHAFYRLTSDQSLVVHVQGYPGMSSNERAMFLSRLMNYEKMMEIRSDGYTSIGNEHGAVVREFPTFWGGGLLIPYSSDVLKAYLEYELSRSV